jgi:hypothetical protein
MELKSAQEGFTIILYQIKDPSHVDEKDSFAAADHPDPADVGHLLRVNGTGGQEPFPV